MKKLNPGDAPHHTLSTETLRAAVAQANTYKMQLPPLPGLQKNSAYRPRFAHRASFYKYCKAQLIKALAPQWTGRRAALKALLRRILSVRRRDVRFLSGLLRLAATPALLAAVLLSVPAQHAQANPACSLSFVQRTGADNPFANMLSGTDPVSGQQTAVDFADWDADGDLDAAVGAEGLSFPPHSGGGPQPIIEVQFYRNDGDALVPTWTNVTGTLPISYGPLGLQTDLLDLDADGDYDLILDDFSSNGGKYYENIGTAESPNFDENPLFGISITDYENIAHGDIDGDGDSDLVIGRANGRFRYVENTGTAVAPAFTERTGAANPLDGIDVGGYAREGFGDIDGDGDLDLIAGNYAGQIRLIANTGTVTAPAFTLLAGAANPFDGVDVGSYSGPSMADIDGDGDLDVVAGEFDGNLNYFENISHRATPVFTELTGASNPLDLVSIGGYAAPTLADLDGDGDLDAVVGGGIALKGAIDTDTYYYENTGSQTSPVFVERTGGANPLSEDTLDDPLVFHASDYDADGDLDMFLGDGWGEVRYLVNSGSAISPAFPNPSGGTDAFPGDVVAYAAPAAVDMDADGDLDLFVGADFGGIRYYENTGSALSGVLEKQNGAANPLNVGGAGGGNAVRFYDFDSDGDLDALSGRIDGTVRYFENTGTVFSPVFEQRTGTLNPLDGVDVGQYARPEIADLNGDGLPEVIIGNVAGNVKYFTAAANCAPPQARCQDITVDLDETGNVTIAGSDLDGGSTVLTGPATFFVSPDTFDCSNLGPNTVTFTVLDGSSNTDTCTATVTVRDVTPPVIPTLPDINRQCGSTPIAGQILIAQDNCDGDMDVYPVFDPSSNPNMAGITTQTYTATDSSGNVSVFVRTITVNDTQAPTFSRVGAASVTVECGDTYDDPGVAFFASGCDDGGEDNLVTVNPVDTGVPGVYIITYNSTDDSGNVGDEVTRTVTVEDTTAPVITLNGGASLAIDCKSAYTDPGANVTEASSAGANVVVGGDTVDITIPGDYTVTYNATDASGNAAAQVIRTVTVLDNCTTLSVDGGGGTVNSVAGDAVTLEVTILDAHGNSNSKQWFYDDGTKAATPLADGGQFSGTNTTTLTIDPVQEDDAGAYYCEVSDDFDTATSSPFTLIVSAALSAVGVLGLAVLSGVLALASTWAARRRTA